MLLIIITLQLNADDRIHSNNIINFKTKIEDIKTLKEIPYNIQHYNKNNDHTSNTIIVSHYTLDHMFAMSIIQNHRKYAKKHGYDYWFRNGIIEHKFTNIKQRYINNPLIFFGLRWQKFTAIKQAMDIKNGDKHKYEWIMWLDGDADFTDMNKNLDDLKKTLNITKDHYFIIAKNASNSIPNNCVNTGVFLIRNNNKSRKFIKNIITSFPVYTDYLSDQTVIQDQIFGLISYDNKCNTSPIAGIKIVNPSIMNSQYSENSTKWKSGDFIAHFTGLPPRAQHESDIVEFFTCIKHFKQSKYWNNCEHGHMYYYDNKKSNKKK